jgi:hypothetical protein
MVNIQIMLCVPQVAMFTEQQSLHTSPSATLLRDAKIILYLVTLFYFPCIFYLKRDTKEVPAIS